MLLALMRACRLFSESCTHSSHMSHALGHWLRLSLDPPVRCRACTAGPTATAQVQGGRHGLVVVVRTGVLQGSPGGK